MKEKPSYADLEIRAVKLKTELDRLKEVEGTLEKERYYLDQAQEIGGIGTWEVDIRTNHLHWTPQMYRMFQIPIGNGIELEKVLSDLLDHEDQQVLNDAWAGALEGKPYDIEHRARVGGEMRWFREKSKLIYDDKGQMITAIGITQDITYRKAVEKKLEEARLTEDDNRYFQRELYKLTGDQIIGANFGLKEIMEKVRVASAVDTPILLLGETGVGKDVIASAIHYSSERKNGPFIKINCGAIPDTLIDSELFGHEKGAFTGAISQKRGCFERAMKGTLFLDEIGELPLQAQVRFLRVLQDKVIERVGGTQEIQLDIRIIAATNRNLHDMVTDKRFREDLWFRLNVFPILVTPLRDRKMDIPALLQYFIEKKAVELKLDTIPEIIPGAIDDLIAYDWPGNVRELQNIVERELILHPDGPLKFEGFNTPKTGISNRQVVKEDYPGSRKLDDVIAHHIQKVLVLTEGRIHGKGGAADQLGVNASTLRNRMNKLGIKYRKKG
jgi:transcriptional regulator with PAS, ATPase and Fis domain